MKYVWLIQLNCTKLDYSPQSDLLELLFILDFHFLCVYHINYSKFDMTAVTIKILYQLQQYNFMCLILLFLYTQVFGAGCIIRGTCVRN